MISNLFSAQIRRCQNNYTFWVDNFNRSFAANQQAIIKEDLYGLYNWTGQAFRTTNAAELVDMDVQTGLNGSFTKSDIPGLFKKFIQKLQRLLISVERFTKNISWPHLYSVTRNPVTVTLNDHQKLKFPLLWSKLQRSNTGMGGNFLPYALTETNIGSNRGKMETLQCIHEMSERKLNDRDQYFILLSDMAIYQGYFKVIVCFYL